MINIINQWTISFLIAAMIAVIIHRSITFTTLVSSYSMEPTLSPGDRLLTIRLHRNQKVRRQDIIVFYSREYQIVMVKRVIGLPGDTVTIQDDGTISINSEELLEPYVCGFSGESGVFKIPERQYMLLGDKRKYSTDSLAWSNPFIGEKEILGKAVFRFYPIKQIQLLKYAN